LTITQIVTAIQNLRAFTVEMASAVSQQTAETKEISINAQSAAARSQIVAANILGLTGQADVTSAASNEVLEATKQLLDHTREVQRNVESFLGHVRAA
jgi:methyl-accepting chemotaxis protein